MDQMSETEWKRKMKLVWASAEWKAKRAKPRGPRYEDTKAKISVTKKGKATRGSGWTHSPETRRKMSTSAKARGEKHNFHKDGKGHERDTERRTAMKGVEYRLWRESVFERDNFTCQECGKRGSTTLHADHIKRWKDHPELRFAVDNGRTLCAVCHLASDTYGHRRAA